MIFLYRIGLIVYVLAAIPYFAVQGFYLRAVVDPMRLLHRPTGIRMLNALIRFWGVNLFRMGIFLCGVKLHVSGFKPEKGKAYLVLSNHQAIVDIAFLFWAFRDTHVKFVMKKELQWGIPNVSPATRRARYVFLDRKAGAEAGEKALAPFAAALKEENVGGVIFPEGTRSRDGNLRKFKVGGVAVLARELPFDVLTVTVDGTWHAATPLDLLKNLPGLDLHLHIEEPFPVERLRRDTAGELEKARGIMEKRLAGFRGKEAQSSAV